MVRRLVVALILIAVMVATVGVGVAQAQQTPPPPAQGDPGAQQAADAQGSAVSQTQNVTQTVTQSSGQQIVGQPTCGPWHFSWYVSRGRYWYFWWWRWCYNPSLPPANQWYIDRAGWGWGPYAGPAYPIGYWSTPQ